MHYGNPSLLRWLLLLILFSANGLPVDAAIVRQWKYQYFTTRTDTNVTTAEPTNGQWLSRSEYVLNVVPSSSHPYYGWYDSVDARWFDTTTNQAIPLNTLYQGRYYNLSIQPSGTYSNPGKPNDGKGKWLIQWGDTDTPPPPPNELLEGSVAVRNESMTRDATFSYTWEDNVGDSGAGLEIIPPNRKVGYVFDAFPATFLDVVVVVEWRLEKYSSTGSPIIQSGTGQLTFKSHENPNDAPTDTVRVTEAYSEPILNPQPDNPTDTAPPDWLQPQPEPDINDINDISNSPGDTATNQGLEKTTRIIWRRMTENNSSQLQQTERHMSQDRQLSASESADAERRHNSQLLKLEQIRQTIEDATGGPAEPGADGQGGDVAGNQTEGNAEDEAEANAAKQGQSYQGSDLGNQVRAAVPALGGKGVSGTLGGGYGTSVQLLVVLPLVGTIDLNPFSGTWSPPWVLDFAHWVRALIAWSAVYTFWRWSLAAVRTVFLQGQAVAPLQSDAVETMLSAGNISSLGIPAYRLARRAVLVAAMIAAPVALMALAESAGVSSLPALLPPGGVVLSMLSLAGEVVPLSTLVSVAAAYMLCEHGLFGWAAFWAGFQKLV